MVETRAARRSAPASACSGSTPTWPATARGSRRASLDAARRAAARRSSPTRSCRRSTSRRCCWSPRGNLFLEGALLLDENLEVDKLRAGALRRRGVGEVRRGGARRLHARRRRRARTRSTSIRTARRARSPMRGERRRAARHRDGGAASAHALGDAQGSQHRARLDASRSPPGDVAVASSLQRADHRCARERDGSKTVALGFELQR